MESWKTGGEKMRNDKERNDCATPAEENKAETVHQEKNKWSQRRRSDTRTPLYTTERKLGKGAFGTVFSGTRLCDGLQVAVKFVIKRQNQQYVQDATGRPVPLEVALMMRVREPYVHRNIIRLIEWFDEPERFILILERPWPSVDLETYVKHFGGYLIEPMARHIMVQVMSAVSACHKRGVLHRDIKLDNFLINTTTLEIKLIDFGCGDWVKTVGYGCFLGTQVNCPPEYFLQGWYFAWPATVWSLGLLLYRMVCGFLPFKNSLDICKGLVYIKGSVSYECCDLINWCLQPCPTWRPSFQQILQHVWLQTKDQFSQGGKEMLREQDAELKT